MAGVEAYGRRSYRVRLVGGTQDYRYRVVAIFRSDAADTEIRDYVGRVAVEVGVVAFLLRGYAHGQILAFRTAGTPSVWGTPDSGHDRRVPAEWLVVVEGHIAAPAEAEAFIHEVAHDE